MSETENPTGEAAAGWYTDPGGSVALRWWAGTAWTEHLAPVPVPIPVPVPVPVHPASLEPWAPTDRASGLFAPTASPIDDWPPHETTVLSITPSGHTWPIWLMATVAAAAAGVRTGATVLPSTNSAIVAFAALLGLVLLLVGLAFWDSSVLRSRGLDSASPWWILLFTPIAYLIARGMALKKLGIRANAAGNLYVLTFFAVAALTLFALTPLADAQKDDASLRLLELQSSTELQRQTSVAWTTNCPNEGRASIVGSTFDCTAADTTGRSVRFTAHVVQPRQFSVDAPVLQ